MPPQQLRPYQERGLGLILDAWKQGARSVLGVAPTGSGKTSLFTSLCAQLASSGQRSVILVHRRELAEQASNRLKEFGIPFGFIMAGEQPRPGALVQIASVQTLVRRRVPQASLVVCDEAHLSTAKTWQGIIEQYPHARILGVSATPWRLSGKPLVGSYDACVVVAKPHELREEGYLCPFNGFGYRAPDLSGIQTTGGDYNEKQSAEAMQQGAIVADVVGQWLKHASDLSTVVFAVTIEHSKQLTSEFKAAGVAAEHLDGSTSLDQRRAILRRVESGVTRVLCNVGVAVEGLDIPRLKCCVLARPTKSLARAIQMMGRVRRPWNGQTARYHDHAFVMRGPDGRSGHGLPDDDRDYTLNARPEAPPPLTTCEVCLALFNGRTCPACAHENEPREMGEREIKTVEDAEQFSFSSDGGEPGAEKPPVRLAWNNPGREIEGVFSRQWEENTQYGKKKTYRVSGKREYDLPGTAVLDRLMKRVTIGDKIRVTQLEDTRNGLKTRHEFRVEVDRENFVAQTAVGQ